MLKRGDRSILALSHGWLTALHPDPHGTTLAAVRRYLEADAAASSTGLWDFVSLPQKGPNGEARSDKDAAMFKSVLDEGIMGNFYGLRQRHRHLRHSAVRGRWRPRLVHL